MMEAACGTGSLTLELAKRYQLLPSDQSEEMLGIAVAKARAQGHILPFVCQDMRELSAHRPAQALVAGCDGVNYLLSTKGPAPLSGQRPSGAGAWRGDCL